MHYYLEKPSLEGVSTESIFSFLATEAGQEVIAKSFSPEYLYWDKLKRKSLPPNISPELAWATVAFMRSRIVSQRKSVVRDEKKVNFHWVTSLPWYEEFLHMVDMNLGGALLGLARDFDDHEKRRFITRGVMEEAIASSQLEGANTARKVAKQMLREGRKPKTKDEQMIVNNYQAMLHIESELKNQSLTLDLVQDLHIMLTKGTLDSSEDEGRFRTNADEVVVQNSVDGTVYHVAPDEKFLKNELDRLISYINNDLKDENFVHPVIKAIIIHFWVGYLHPFVDGNGRLARVLFYWFLIKNDYWGFAYLPLSKAIKNSPDQYKMAYIYTEQDNNDLTYFIDYNVRKITASVSEFKEYEKQLQSDNSTMVRNARTTYHLNDRQIQLLQFYNKKKDEGVSVRLHMGVNDIARATAIADLVKLEEKKFVSKKKVGRKVYYYATGKVDILFK